MSQTLFWLEDNSQSKTYTFGTSAAGGEGSLTVEKGTASTATVGLNVKNSAQIGGDLYVAGNFTYAGTIDRTVVTNSAYKDIDLLLNSGGTTASATGAGLLIEGDTASVIGKLLFDNSLTSKWKIGDGATQVEVVTVSGTQTLTNKTLTGAQVSGNISGNAANVTGTVAVGNGGTGATSLSGLLKGNGTAALSAATAGTDYSAGTAALGTGILKSTTATGALTIAVAGDFPILNQNTSGSAATLTTARNIFGNSFNGSADVTGVIGAQYGGTGNGFTAFSGAATTTKTYTLPNANATILTDNALVTVAQGGTGLSSITAGSILVGNGTSAPTLVAPGTSGNVLTSNGTSWVSSAPSGSAAYERWTTVSGTQDGVNKVFTIGNALAAGSEVVYVDGIARDSGASNDYILSGTTLTFQAAMVAPRALSKIKVRGTY